jgi:hypothetical protein
LAGVKLVSPQDAESILKSYNIPDRAELAEEFEEFLSSDVVATSWSDLLFSIDTAYIGSSGDATYLRFLTKRILRG